MAHRFFRYAAVGAVTGLLAWCGAAAQAAPVSYQLTAVADASIFGSSTDPACCADLADSRSDNLWSANTAGGRIRRLLLRFDLAQIPAGSRVLSAQLQLYEIRSRNTHTSTLHRVLAPWGEGQSDGGDGGDGVPATPGDPTWRWRVYPDQPWVSLGGDHAASPSSSVLVGAANQSYRWPSTPQLVAEVQAGVDAPATHHGWMLIGREDADQTAKRWASRENAVTGQRPTLIVEVEPPAPADDSGEVPLPAWALLLLGGGLLAARCGRQR